MTPPMAPRSFTAQEIKGVGCASVNSAILNPLPAITSAARAANFSDRNLLSKPITTNGCCPESASLT